MEELVELARWLITEGDPISKVLGVGVMYLLYKTRALKKNGKEDVRSEPSAPVSNTLVRALLSDYFREREELDRRAREDLGKVLSMLDPDHEEYEELPSERRLMDFLDEKERSA